jgi:rod shape determining protein RodA
MMYDDFLQENRSRRTVGSSPSRMLTWLKVDGWLVTLLLLISVIGLVVLASAAGGFEDDPTADAQRAAQILAHNKQTYEAVLRTVVSLVLGMGAMLALARVNPNLLRRYAPGLYLIGVMLLVVVAVAGKIGLGAKRWLAIGGFIHFQPSELMKIAVPMMCAQFLHDRALPPSFGSMIALAFMILIPVGLVVIEPDLGTGALIAAGGALVIIMAGLRLRVMALLGILAGAGGWFGWSFMKDYQKARVLTFLDPHSDPKGAGYHILQSIIGIGSGGWTGKGWMKGSQAQQGFLPERSTDFIFAVIGEEWGFLGVTALLLLYLLVVARALYLSMQTQDTFARLLSGSLALTFFVYVFINAGMVTGLVPVVGVPLPLVSYGGTSVVTLLAGFGILMALHTHRKLIGS